MKAKLRVRCAAMNTTKASLEGVREQCRSVAVDEWNGQPVGFAHQEMLGRTPSVMARLALLRTATSVPFVPPDERKNYLRWIGGRWE